jgi:lipopolysaccharide/colanic/teichoic acid biosynthesis glycosyltransferase
LQAHTSPYLSIHSFVVDLLRTFDTVSFGKAEAPAMGQPLVLHIFSGAFLMLPHDMLPNVTAGERGIFQASNGNLIWNDSMSAAAQGRLTWGGESLLMAAAAVLTGAFSSGAAGSAFDAGVALAIGLSELYAGFAILAWSQTGTDAPPTRSLPSWLRPAIAIVAIGVMHCGFRASLAYPMHPLYRTIEFPAAVALIVLVSRGILLWRDPPTRRPACAARVADHDALAAGRPYRGYTDMISQSQVLQKAEAGEFASSFDSSPLQSGAGADVFGAPRCKLDVEPRPCYGGAASATRCLSDWEQVQKAGFDLILSLLLLPFLGPIMLVIVVAVCLESRGPILFRQPRVGLNGTIFTIFKFRTMYHHVTDVCAEQQTSRGDPRVTKVGRVLRKYSLDELPQLFNVLRGDMSLVGPRPHTPQTKAAGIPLAQAVQEYHARHTVKPGITGWAQVNGARGELTSIHQLRKRVAHDLFYITNWSVFFDIEIIVMTIHREVFSEHAF